LAAQNPSLFQHALPFGGCLFVGKTLSYDRSRWRVGARPSQARPRPFFASRPNVPCINPPAFSAHVSACSRHHLVNFVLVRNFYKKCFISFILSPFWELIIPLCSTRRDE
jgi:hypothetical protein